MESPERNEEIEKVKAKQAEQWAKVVRQVGPPTLVAAVGVTVAATLHLHA